jgi:hypothetical protein
MNIGVLALVGTRKGLFLLSGHDHRRCWPLDGPLLDSWAVYHATVDYLFPFRKAKTAGGPRP